MSLSFYVMQYLNCLFVEVFIKFALIWLEIISDIRYKLSLDLSLIQGCLIRIYSIVLYGLGNSFLTISGNDQQEINLSPCRLFSQHLWDQSQDSEKTIELLVYEGERERGGNSVIYWQIQDGKTPEILWQEIYGGCLAFHRLCTIGPCWDLNRYLTILQSLNRAEFVNPKITYRKIKPICCNCCIV